MAGFLSRGSAESSCLTRFAAAGDDGSSSAFRLASSIAFSVMAVVAGVGIVTHFLP